MSSRLSHVEDDISEDLEAASHDDGKKDSGCIDNDKTFDTEEDIDEATPSKNTIEHKKINTSGRLQDACRSKRCKIIFGSAIAFLVVALTVWVISWHYKSPPEPLAQVSSSSIQQKIEVTGNDEENSSLTVGDVKSEDTPVQQKVGMTVDEDDTPKLIAGEVEPEGPPFQQKVDIIANEEEKPELIAGEVKPEAIGLINETDAALAGGEEQMTENQEEEAVVTKVRPQIEIDILSFLEKITTTEALLDEADPRGKAFHRIIKELTWLTKNDLFHITSTENYRDFIVQRFGMMVLGYSTDVENWSKSIGWLPSLIDGDTDEKQESQYVNECEWWGVTCENGRHISGINLMKNQVGGTLPDEIFEIPTIEKFVLSKNMIGGTLPSALFALTNLTILDLDFNEMNGSIPKGISALADLEVFEIDNNQFTGSIPEELYQLSSLKVLEVQNNLLDGGISRNIGNLSLLKEFVACGNSQLAGSVPEEVGKLQNIKRFYIQKTNVTGVIPGNLCGNVNVTFGKVKADCDSNVECSCCTRCNHRCRKVEG